MHRPTNEPWSHAKNRSVWPSLRVKITRRKKWTWIIIFKPAEPRSPWNACVYTVVQLLLICLCVCLCTVVSGLQSKARFTGERKAVWSEVTGCWRYSPPVCARATWNAYSSAANVCQVCVSTVCHSMLPSALFSYIFSTNNLSLRYMPAKWQNRVLFSGLFVCICVYVSTQ